MYVLEFRVLFWVERTDSGNVYGNQLCRFVCARNNRVKTLKYQESKCLLESPVLLLFVHRGKFFFFYYKMNKIICELIAVWFSPDMLHSTIRYLKM